MEKVKIKITMRDVFSGAYNWNYAEVEYKMFEQMKAKDIGKVISRFDKKDQIRYGWKVVNIELA